MAQPRIYVETTIPSYYFDERQASDIPQKREWTRAWWEEARTGCELVTSIAVWVELFQGPEHRQAKWLPLLYGIPLLPLDPQVRRIEQTYIETKLMPSAPDSDALHLAFASFYRCDCLATWNYRHLANPNKFKHIERVNVRLGLFTPRIVSPRELIGGPSGR